MPASTENEWPKCLVTENQHPDACTFCKCHEERISQSKVSCYHCPMKDTEGTAESTPTQCTDDVIVGDWDLHQPADSLHCTLAVHEEPAEKPTGLSLEVEDVDLPLGHHQELQELKEDRECWLKYVEDGLGLHYNDDSTKEKASSRGTVDSDDGIPLEISIYLKDPQKPRRNRQRAQVYMLHAPSTQATGNKESRNSFQPSGFANSELMRLSTYSNFPPSIGGLYVSRLAKSGFAYLPELALLECCFCQLRLPPSEFVGVVPDEIHKRKSPTCTQVRDVQLGTERVAVVSTPAPSASHQAGPQSPVFGGVQDSTRAYQTDTAMEYVPQPVQEDRATHSSASTRGVEQADSVPTPTSPAPPDTARRSSSSSLRSTIPPASLTTVTTKLKPDAPKEKKKLTYSDLGIFAEKPKRPEMAVVQKRMASFQGKWKPEYTQTPKMLAEAGMYYAGWLQC